jgi:hypothetical protein
VGQSVALHPVRHRNSLRGYVIGGFRRSAIAVTENATSAGWMDLPTAVNLVSHRVTPHIWQIPAVTWITLIAGIGQIGGNHGVDDQL